MTEQEELYNMIINDFGSTDNFYNWYNNVYLIQDIQSDLDKYYNIPENILSKMQNIILALKNDVLKKSTKIRSIEDLMFRDGAIIFADKLITYIMQDYKKEQLKFIQKKHKDKTSL